MLATDLFASFQVSGRWDEHAGLGLDGLDQEGHGVLGDSLFQGIGVTVGDGFESRRVGSEVFLVEFFSREANDGRGTAVEILSTRDDLRLVQLHALFRVSPFASRFDGRFHGLCAGIHREHHFHAGEFTDFLTEEGKLVVAERA